MGWLNNQVKGFIEIRPVYLTYAAVLQGILEKVCERYACMGRVDSRTKTIGSFAEKALRKREKYSNPLAKMTDLAGARIVALTLEDVKNCCRYIEGEPGFVIDWENSLDMRQQLKTERFGYNAVHYVVELRRDSILGVEIPREIRSVPGKLSCRAEIQIQTMLQNVWSAIGHDRLYKTMVKVPASFQREINAVAAVLESADRLFDRSVKTLDHYIRNFSAYREPADLQREIEMLQAIFEQAPHDREAVYQLGRRFMSAERWEEAFKTLSLLKNTGRADILRDIGESAYRAGIAGREEVREYFTKACRLNPEDFSAKCLLAETYHETDPGGAVSLYEDASALAPDEPSVLVPLIECSIINDGTLDKVVLMRGLLSGIQCLCRERAVRGVHLPHAYFQCARIHLYRGEVYAALNSYSEAVSACHMPGLILRELNSLERITGALGGGRGRDSILGMKFVEGFELSRRMLALILYARSLSVSPQQTGFYADAWMKAGASVKKHVEELGSKPENKRKFKQPLVIVAGSCDPDASSELKTRYGRIFREAFSSFSGTIISGGTVSGISGMVGSLRPSKGREITRIAYLPRDDPFPARRSPAYEIRESPGEGYNPAGVMTAWADMLLQGIKPEQVRIFAINGGELTGFELRLGVALGAGAGVSDDSGNKLKTLLGETPDLPQEKLLPLPADPAVWKAFLMGAESAAGRFPARYLERAARGVHEQFRKDCEDNPAKHDASVLSWEKLPEEYRSSNRHQVLFSGIILDAAGFDIQPVSGGEKIDPENPPLPEEFSRKIMEMARLEHGRFCVERLMEGWRYGPEKNLKQKTSPAIVPWDELDEEAREFDVYAVKIFPRFLAEAGLKIVRRK